jgi:hypothetical protein
MTASGRTQLVRGVGDEALLDGDVLADGTQRAARVEHPADADHHDDARVDGEELPAQRAEGLRDVLLLVVVGRELLPRRAADVAAEAQVHEEARDQHEQDDQAGEQQRQTHLGAGEDVRTARLSHRPACSRRRAR